MSNDPRKQIEKALTEFGKPDLALAATGLLNTLGYRSEKLLDLDNTSAAFLAQFDNRDRPLRKDKALVDQWKSVEFLFQLTDDEIRNAGAQLTLGFNSGYDAKNYQSYLFLALDLKKDHYTRTDLSSITREVNRLFDMPAMLLLRHNGALTIAVIDRRLHKRDESRDVLEKVTLIKDIRCESPHRAHMEILHDLSLPSLIEKHECRDFVGLHEAWRKTLDTQALNNRFYSELAAWYYWAVNTICLPVVADYLKERGDAGEENVKQFTIRLLCRTIFCWFLKERGLIDPCLLELSDDADRDVVLVRRPAKASEFAAANSYYRGILQNIFFNCLNTPMNERRLPAARAAYDKTVKDPKLKRMKYRGKQHLPEDFDYNLFDKIPYLNGGLFDKLEEDNARDDITDAAIHIPNELFYAAERKFTHNKKTLTVKGLNRILDGYKFTIAENTPLEEEIALDPELLGLVFENLLAEVDTSDEAAATSARRASGTYYTPRRVIDYMVNEALRLHLENYIRARAATHEERKSLQELLYNDTFDPAQKRLAGWIVEAFDEIRILDPACGSGAFPMGALHRMVAILQRVDPQNRRWLHRQVSHIPDQHLREKAEEDLVRHADDYSRKLGLIKNAVYGVDIQPLAVLITKLRFFISLLVDQNINLKDPTHNYGLTPLPNLETKVLCANTLREVQVSLFEREAIRKYQKARDDYYQPKTTADRREELAEEIAAALSELLPGFSMEVTGHEYKDRRTQNLRNRELLKEWFRHSTLPAPFFNFSVFFPEICANASNTNNGSSGQTDRGTVLSDVARHGGGGFDIVIGNPPYGGNKIPDEVREALGLTSKDPYGAFIARFMRDGKKSSPLRIGGVLTYIVSDTFMTIKTHHPLREQLMGSRIHKMIRVHPDTFSATVNTAIILLQKGGGPCTKPPSQAELAEAWDKGPWCQMVDLTQVSIHKQHDRFLTLLFDTVGGERRRDVATESCAVYHYPQSLIATNTNLPFFVASPKLFALMNDTAASVVHEEIGGKPVPVRTVTMNGRNVRLVKLGDIAEVKQGLATGDNDAYLFQVPTARGSYRSIEDHRRHLLSRSDLDRICDNPVLRLDVIEHGISKTNKNSPRYFEGRYILPYDKGGESDSEGGWMPNYYVPTDYFIDWSEAAVLRLKTLTTRQRNQALGKAVGDERPCSRFQNAESYFLPAVTFSPTGQYAPTFRFHDPSVYDKEGSCIFSGAMSHHSLTALLASKLTRYFQKVAINGTVHSMQGDLDDSPIALRIPCGRVDSLVTAIVQTQRANSRYDYASHEQLEIDRLVYEAYGLNREDISEVETWYARRYPKLAAAQRRNLRATGKVPNFDRWCVYCDETGHLAYDHATNMILGALLVPRERVRPLTMALRERLAALGWPAKRELKWTKVSPAGLKFYETALDFFLNEPDLRFRALITPKNPPPSKLAAPPPGADKSGSSVWAKYNKLLEDSAPEAVDFLHRHDAWYYDCYFELLRETLIPPAHHAIYVDVKDTRGGVRIREMETRLTDAHYDWTQSGIVEGISQIASRDVLLDQLVDFLLGCVAWIHTKPQRNLGHKPSTAKAFLAAKVKTILDQPDTALVPKIVIHQSPERSPAI